MIVGVTTAATLWLVTVIGLCFGGGQLVLGTAPTLLGLLALWVLKWVEDKLRRERTARFAIEVDAGGPRETEIRRRLRNSNLSISQSHRVVDAITGHRRLIFHVRELRRHSDTTTPDVINELEQVQGVLRLNGAQAHERSRKQAQRLSSLSSLFRLCRVWT